MKMLKRALLIAAVMAVPTVALAMDGQLVGKNDTIVLVWKNKDAHNEGLDLIIAGVHKTKPALVMRLLSCTVKSGTRAITTDAGIITHDIMVVEGKNTGCRGNVASENFKPSGLQ